MRVADMTAAGHMAASGGPRLSASRVRAALGALIGLTVAGTTYMYGFSLYLKPMQADTGWSRGAILAGLAATTLTTVMLIPLVGILIDRWGGKIVGLIGCLLLPLSIVLLGQQGSYAEFLAVAILAGVGCAFASPPAYMAIVSQWFDRGLGTAIAIASTGVGLASIALPPIAQVLIEAHGWRSAVALIGIGVALIGVGNNLLLIRENPAFVAARRSHADDDVIPLEGASFRECLRSGDFWKLSIAFLLIITVVSGCYLNMVALATDRGVSAADAAVALSVYGATSIVARLSTGVLIDRVAVGIPATIFFTGTAAGVAMLWAGWPGNYLILAAAMLGFGAGCEGDLMPFVLKRRFGMRAYGRLFGVMLAIFQLGPLSGPLMMGAIYDRSGAYDSMFLPFILFASVAVALFAWSSIAWRSPRQ